MKTHHRIFLWTDLINIIQSVNTNSYGPTGDEKVIRAVYLGGGGGGGTHPCGGIETNRKRLHRGTQGRRII